MTGLVTGTVSYRRHDDCVVDAMGVMLAAIWNSLLLAVAVAVCL